MTLKKDAREKERKRELERPLVDLEPQVVTCSKKKLFPQHPFLMIFTAPGHRHR